MSYFHNDFDYFENWQMLTDLLTSCARWEYVPADNLDLSLENILAASRPTDGTSI